MKLVWILCAAQVASAAGPIQLSLKRAVEAAVSPEGNTKSSFGRGAENRPQAKSAQARRGAAAGSGSLLTGRTRRPTWRPWGYISACLFRAFSSRPSWAPFTTMDARATVTQSVFDFSSNQTLPGVQVGISAARSDVDSTEEQVAAQVARAYLRRSARMPTWKARSRT